MTNLKIHSVDGGFVAAIDDGWVPGCYESVYAAQLACEVLGVRHEDVMQQLQDAANARGGNQVITAADLEAKIAELGL